MALVFVSAEHEVGFQEAMKSVNGRSVEVCLYLLTAVKPVREKMQDVWKGYVDFNVLENVNLSDGERALVALALNLYNGYEMEDVSLSPTRLFGSVDNDLKQVVLSALGYRFSKAG